MGQSDLRKNEQYYKIENYAMKCRLYPNKKMAEKIDAAIYGIQCFYNCTLYEIFTNRNLLVEYPKKTKVGKHTDEIVHFVDYNAVGGVEWRHKIINEHPLINNAPISAITCKSGVINDMKKSLGKKPIEYQVPSFYCKAKPRNSYSYQDYYGKITLSDNNNVIYINLAKVGICKVRGWNKRIRFNENGLTNFIEFCNIQPRTKRITLTISKDNCGDYWITFKLPYVYKPMAKPNTNIVGVDVGIKDVAILSDGTKYENKRYKTNQKGLERKLSQQLSRRQGYKNEEFRKKLKKDKSLRVSKRYLDTQLRLSRLHRDIARKRESYNNQVTSDIVSKSSFIGIESLNVKGMFKNHHLAKALEDASMGSILSMLKYKSEWYNRIIQPINQWTPSSKRCSCCGYVIPKLSLSTREWDCPKCNVHHDRDINAAQNIKHYALDTYKNECVNT